MPAAMEGFTLGWVLLTGGMRQIVMFSALWTSRAATAALFVTVLAASPDFAFDANQLGQGGSLSLTDISSLIDQSAQLKSEVAAALTAAHKAADEIICGGHQFRNQRVNLGGMRAAP